MRIALTFAAMLALATPVLAQEGDWDLVQEPGRLTMATLDFGTNALAIRCQQGVFEFILTGMPVAEAGGRLVSVTIGARAQEQRYWTTLAGTTYLFAVEPERMARQLRGGGVLDIRLEPANDAERARRYQFPVPPSAIAVNQVLQACGERLEDDRDTLPRAGPVRWAFRPTPYYPENGAAMRARAGRVELNCIIADDLSLKDCRVESEEPAHAGFGESALRAAREARLEQSGDAVSGSVVSFPIAFRLP